MKDDPRLAGITELADEAGMERGRAARILRSSGLKRDQYKRWPRAEALDMLGRHVDVAQQAAQHATGMGAHSQAAGLEDYAAARARSEAARAEKLRQEIEIRAGKLVDRASVIDAGAEFAFTLRNGLLGIPAKVAGRLVGKSRDEILGALDEEIRHALTSLADIDTYIFGGAS